MKTFRYSVVMAMTYFAVNAATGNSSFFLKSNGYSDGEVGFFVALAGIIASLLQPLIGIFADKTKRINLEGMIGLLTLCMALAAIPLALGLDGRTVLVSIFFISAMVDMYVIMPLVNALGMYYVNKGKKLNFGLARGFGSIAYTIAAIVIGILAKDEFFGPKVVPVSIIISSILLIFATGIFNIKISKNEKEIDPFGMKEKKAGIDSKKFREKYPEYFVFLIGVTLLFVGHNVINTFSYQFCVDLGRGVTENGIISGVAAIVELPVMFGFSYLVKKFKVSTLITVSAIFFSVKILTLTIAMEMKSIDLLYLSVYMQMLAFALFIPASVYYANSIIDKKDMAQGQSYMTTTNTLGAVIGSWIGGYLVEFTSSTITLWIMFAISVLGTLICFKHVDRSIEIQNTNEV